MAQSFNTKDYAIYLPAINTGYANFLTKPIPQGRPFPAGLAIEDFCIWNKNSKLFYHPYLLHSIGNFNALSTVNNSITQAASGDFTLVGDSGGYQIGSGALKGVEGFKKGMSAKAYDWDTGASKFYTEDRREGREMTLDFQRLIDIVVKAGYNGYIGIEYEGDKHSEMEGIARTKQALDELKAMIA